jgi:hypothetical protein
MFTPGAAETDVFADKVKSERATRAMLDRVNLMVVVPPTGFPQGGVISGSVKPFLL